MSKYDEWEKVATRRAELKEISKSYSKYKDRSLKQVKCY